MKKLLIGLCLFAQFNTQCGVDKEDSIAADDALALKHYILGDRARLVGNIKEALNHYLISASKGHVEAMVEAGAIYMDLRESAASEPEKKRLEQKALEFSLLGAKNNNALAMYNLAYQYAKKGDFLGAVDWYRKAALRNNHQSQAALGELLLSLPELIPGRAIKAEEYTEAKVWLEIAVLHGHIGACLSLGIWYLQESKKMKSTAEKEDCLVSAIAFLKKTTELTPKVNMNGQIIGSLESQNKKITQAYYNLASAYASMGELATTLEKKGEWALKLAVPTMQAALKRGPRNP